MMFPNSIFTSILRSIVFSLSILTITLDAAAQQTRRQAQEPLPANNANDSTRRFTGLQITADMVGPIQLLVSDYGQYEVGVRLGVKNKYFPALELGLGKADHTSIITQTSYDTSAPYGKIGMDFNIIKNKHDIYRVLVGFRYAYTNFKFNVAHANLTDPVWGGTTPFAGHDIKASYHWAELLAGVDAKIWGPLHLGWSVRYKRRLKHNNGELGNAWYVPGFGKQGSSRIAGTFDVSLAF